MIFRRKSHSKFQNIKIVIPCLTRKFHVNQKRPNIDKGIQYKRRCFAGMFEQVDKTGSEPHLYFLFMV